MWCRRRGCVGPAPTGRSSSARPPAERAVYLLRIAFDYPYRQISGILHLSEDHARQLLRRARFRRGGALRPGVDVAATERREGGQAIDDVSDLSAQIGPARGGDTGMPMPSS
ncbi:sigma factor-like helix-turn-helix DNA-binding protein [Nonomuraea jabiensis]|uniref:sigma factor-like helix-turn-helix DNA-binding protein n=1 Tax=Nonomuraea jabiensis TaxID=882448 RepID=UPI0036925DA5